MNLMAATKQKSAIDIHTHTHTHTHTIGCGEKGIKI